MGQNMVQWCSEIRGTIFVHVVHENEPKLCDRCMPDDIYLEVTQKFASIGSFFSVIQDILTSTHLYWNTVGFA